MSEFQSKKSAFENPPQQEPTAKQKAAQFEAEGRREKNKDALNKFKVNINKGRKLQPTGNQNTEFQGKKSAFESQ